MNYDIINEYCSLQRPNKKSFEICYSDMKCNMNCAYCYGDHRNRSFNNSFPLNEEFFSKEFEKVRDSISDIHLWGGELLFNGPEFKKMVSLVRRFFPDDTPVHVVTNGILLPQWTQYLIDNKITIGLSHDGPGQKYRGMDYLQSQEHNEAIKKLFDHGLFRKFKSILHNKNSSTEAIIKFFDDYSQKIGRKVGCDVLLISPNSLSDNAYIFKSEEDKRNLYNDTLWSTTDILKNLENPKYLLRYYQVSDIYRVVRVLDIITGKKPSSYIARCDGTNNIAFTSDGKRIPCHCFSEKVIVNQEIKVDASYVYQKCSKCKFAYICGGGCSAHTNKELDLYCIYSYVRSQGITDAVQLALDTLNNEENQND